MLHKSPLWMPHMIRDKTKRFKLQSHSRSSDFSRISIISSRDVVYGLICLYHRRSRQETARREREEKSMMKHHQSLKIKFRGGVKWKIHLRSFRCQASNFFVARANKTVFNGTFLLDHHFGCLIDDVVIEIDDSWMLIMMDMAILV